MISERDTGHSPDWMHSRIQEGPISPSALACACWAYGALEKYLSSLAEFHNSIGAELDLARSDHRDALLVWLNKWKCRIPEYGHPEVKARLDEWYSRHRTRLPSAEIALSTASDSDLKRCGELYASVMETMKRVDSGSPPLKFRWTAASKTLFALRPRLAPAWDDAIRNNHLRGGKKYDRAEASYVRFAKDVRQDLRDTDDLCATLDFRLEDMPVKLGRPAHTTAVQLMIEYYFVIITKKAGPPPSCFGVDTSGGR